jgi:hypothetical protein
MLATCHTDGCGNNGIPIDVGDLTYTDDETGQTYPMTAVCGVCGQPIDDLTEPDAGGRGE